MDIRVILLVSLITEHEYFEIVFSKCWYGIAKSINTHKHKESGICMNDILAADGYVMV